MNPNDGDDLENLQSNRIFQMLLLAAEGSNDACELMKASQSLSPEESSKFADMIGLMKALDATKSETMDDTVVH